MPRSGVREHELNLDRRLTRVEQILPTLATKADVETAISAAVAPLATRAELAAAIAPLATKAELAALEAGLRAEIRASAERTEHRVQVLLEGMDGKLDLLVEGVQAGRARTEEVRIELKEDIAKLDRRVMRLEAAQLKRR